VGGAPSGGVRRHVGRSHPALVPGLDLAGNPPFHQPFARNRFPRCPTTVDVMPRLLRVLLLPGRFACCIALLLHGAVVRGGGVWPRDRASLRMTMVRADAVELRRLHSSERLEPTV